MWSHFLSSLAALLANVFADTLSVMDRHGARPELDDDIVMYKSVQETG